MFNTAEILVVGSEFFSPLKLDSNSYWLTEQLEGRGVRVQAKRVLADDLSVLTAAFQQAMASVDLVVATGGLGPTLDDRTRDAVAAAFGVDLCLDQAIVDDIAAKFERRGRAMTDNNRRQALIPAGFKVLANPGGTAPGFYHVCDGPTVLLLPGPPREMQGMFEVFVQRCAQHFPERSGKLCTRVLKVSGLGESDMDSRIQDLYGDRDNPEVTINFTPDDLEIHLKGRGDTEESATSLVEDLSEKIRERLEGYLFSEQGESLAQVVSRLLQAQGLTVATAESVTGGLVAHRLSSIPGASQRLKGGVVAYTEENKVRHLSVPEELLRACSAVSPGVALKMAEAVRRDWGADLGVSTTGYAGPGGGTPEEPVGTIYVALATAHGSEVSRLEFPGDRDLVCKRGAQAALFKLWGYLNG